MLKIVPTETLRGKPGDRGHGWARRREVTPLGCSGAEAFPAAARARRVGGIDVGGTFTDIVVHENGPEGPRVRVGQGAHHAAQPDRRRAGGDRRGGRRARRSRPPDPRHHRHHQRHPGAQDRPRRADHHDGLPRHAGAGPPHPAEALRHDRHLRAAGAARPPHRGRRAHGRPGQRGASARRGRGGRCGPRPPRQGLRERRHPLPALPTPTRRTSCARARSCARSGPTTT